MFDRNTFANLENISCSIKEKCASGHGPWPKGKNLFSIKVTLMKISLGICTKCQPNPLTLMRQVNRKLKKNCLKIHKFSNRLHCYPIERISKLISSRIFVQYQST